MSNIKKFNVKYPQKEEAVAIVAQNNTPFHDVIIGITYPYADYRVKRNGTDAVNVFEYILEGEGEILLDGKWHHAAAGDIYVLRQMEPHEYHSDPKNPWKKIWINYTASYISAFLDAYGIESGIYRAENARVYFEQLFSYTKGDGSYMPSNYDIAATVHCIIHAIASSRKDERTPERIIREALDSAVYEKLNLDALADALHMSKSNVIRIFKKHYGVTPYEYLISLKITTAKVLLKNTRMTIREIAGRLCIADEHYFSSLFLAKVGMRPREYRKAHS